MIERFAGRYALLRRLGLGGMGEVFLARDVSTGAECALKRLHARGERPHDETLRREFEALTRIRHPSVVSVSELGFAPDGSPYLVMEYVPGLPADQVLARGDWRAAVGVAVDVAHGLEALHALGVVHGDLKPSNILVVGGGPGTGAFADVRLVDFGLAALFGREEEGHRGTAGFAAPEVVLGAPPTPASDLYGLGASLWALLAGRAPFDQAAADSRLRQQHAGPPPARPLEEAGVPGPLIEIVLGLMANDPAERPESARAVRRELERVHPPARRTLAERLHAATVVGRERELSRADAWVARAPQPPAILVVEGEAGIGKSAFLGEVATRATLAGRAALHLSCAVLEGPGATAKAIARVIAARRPPAAAGRADAPALALAESDAPLSAAELAALTEAAVRWAHEAAARGGLLVILDDADRMDALSASWLRRVALHPSAPPLRWLLARRPALDPGTDESGVLFEAALAMRLALEPLGRDDLARLAAARLHAPAPPELLEVLVRNSVGHPGLVVELLHAAAAGGAIEELESGIRVNPARLGVAARGTEFEALRAERLAHLSEPARAALAVLAVCESPLAAAEVARLAPEADDAVLRSLAAIGIAVPAEDGRWSLRPPAVAERVREALEPARRAELHRAALALPGRTARQRFRHERELGNAARALEEAAAAFALDPDARLAAEAAVLAEGVDPAAAAAWHERAALALRAGGRYAAAIAHLERALALDPAPDGRGARWVLLTTATLRGASPADVPPQVSRALEEEVGDAARAQLLVNLGGARLALGEREEAERVAAEAWTLAERSGDALAQAEAAQLLASFALARRDLDRAEELAERVADACRAAGHAHGVVRSIGARAAVARTRFRYAEAERLLREAIELARPLENRMALSEQQLYLSGVLVEAGKWRQAREPSAEAARVAIEDGRAAEAAVAVAHLAQVEGLLGRSRTALRRARAAIRLCRRFRPDLESYAWRSRAQAERLLGRLRRAERAARTAQQLAPAAGGAEESRWCRLELGRVLAAQGRWNEAARAWDPAASEAGAGAPAADAPETVADALLLVATARASLRRGDTSIAIRRLETIESWCAERPAPLVAAFSHVLRAEIAFGQHRGPDALEAGRRALAALGALPAPAERAHAALDLAQMAPAAPELRDTVCEWLERAERGFERLGDHRGRERALALTVEWLRRPVTSAPAAPGAPDSGLIDRVSWLLQSLTDLQELTRRAMRAAVEQLGAERGVLLMTDTETGRMAPMAEFGAVEAATRDEALSYSRRVVQQVTESGGSLLIKDAPGDPRAASESVQALHLRSILCVPMFLGGRTVGAVYLDDSRRPHAFGDAERGLLEGFAHLMAVAIEKSRRHEEVRRENELLEGENRSLRLEIGARMRAPGVVGTSAAMQRVYAMVEHAARTNTTVLITGENGTGKELVARTLHHSGKRRMGPFVAVNCGAIPETLLESELFGILPNVATGVRARPGKFVQANGGTLFLDEIGEMPPSQQVALLSALANREVTPVGGGRPEPIDVRIIAATNANLRRLVEEGRFREDLYYRLNVIEIEMPALRERKADIPALVQHFVRQFAGQQERPEPTLSPDFLAVLMQSDWPGNVRELQNYVERVVAMTPGTVLRPDPLPHDLDRGRDGLRAIRGRRLNEVVRAMEQRMIREALERAGGNQSQAARDLGITEQAVRYRIRRLGLPASRESRRIRQTRRDND